MIVEPDDEIYQVNAVWLGPPRATLPWHVRYVAWGVGIVVFFLVLAAERVVGIGMGVFSLAWALVITVVVTRWLCSRIDYERPFGAVASLLLGELRTPREERRALGGVLQPARQVPIRRRGVDT